MSRGGSRPVPGGLLRDVTEDDLPIFSAQQREPEALRLAAFPARDSDAFRAHWAKILADDTVTTKTVVVDGQVAGNVVSWLPADRREVGYWLGRGHWGRGIATAALAELLDQVTARPVYAHAAKHNVASIRVLENCGFEREEQGSHVVMVDGQPVEEVLLVLRR